MNEARQSIPRSILIANLGQTHSALAALTSSLPEDEADSALDFKAAPDDWSVREILAHLVDDEMYVMRTRLERMIKEDHPTLAPHDESRWYANRNKTRDGLDQLLVDFALQRAASLGIIRMLRDEDWSREGFQPEIGHFTAEEWLAKWLEHDNVHLRQIEATLLAYRTRTDGAG